MKHNELIPASIKDELDKREKANLQNTFTIRMCDKCKYWDEKNSVCILPPPKVVGPICLLYHEFHT